MRIDADDEKIRIGGNRNAWSARQLQRMLGRLLERLSRLTLQTAKPLLTHGEPERICVSSSQI